MTMKQNYLRVGWSLATLFLFLFCSAQSFAQTTVSGTVSEFNGPPIPGVAVTVTGTTIGVATGADGKYTITVPAGKNSLTFVAVGYVKKTITVDGRTTINVGLASDVANLGEIVVTGYQTQRKGDITGAVSVVSPKDIRSTPTSNVGSALQGRVPGVTISTDPNPGGNVDIRVRGFSTINSNNPLIIVDGIQLNGTLSDINPADIESIQVLKDASSASIYGARAAGGVVLVTTRKGKTGRTQISLDGYSGFAQVPNSTLPKLLNTQQYANQVWVNYANTTPAGVSVPDPLYGTYAAGTSPVIPQYLVAGLVSNYTPGAAVTAAQADPKLYNYSPLDPTQYYTIVKANQVGTNWYDAILRKGLVQSYTLAANGGSENSHFYISANYLEQKGTLKYTYYNRAGFRANSDFTVKDHIRFGESINFTYSNGNGIGDGGEGNQFSFAYRIQPIVPVYDISGTHYAGTLGKGLGNAKNPLAQLYRSSANSTITTRLLGNTYLDFDIISGLSFKTSFGADLININGSYFNQPDLEDTEGVSSTSFQNVNQVATSWTLTNILTYKKTFGKSNFKAFVGQEGVENQYREFDATRTNYGFVNDPTYRYLSAGQGVQTNGSSQNTITFNSYFAQVNYDFDGKYLIEGRFRRDASSVFLGKYGNFPGGSVAWRISKENFMANIKWITDLKLRVGYGVVGNSNIPAYNGYNQFSSSFGNNDYPIGGGNNSTSPGFSLTQLGNVNTTWEEDKTLNGGFDASILNGTVNIVLDVYKNQSDKLLNAPNIPATQGSASPASLNIGTAQNTGFDIGVTYNGKSANGKFKYSIGANASHYKNLITKLDNANGFLDGGGSRANDITRTQAGHPISQFYGYKVIGIFKDAASAAAAPDQTALGIPNQAGTFQYADVNGDGKIDANDRTFIGDPNPKIAGGLTLEASYEGFDFNAFLQGVAGNSIFNYTKYFTDFQPFPGNFSTRVLNSWTPTNNTNPILPVFNASLTGTESQISSYYVESGSYARLKSLQVGYTFPKKLMSKMGVDRLRLYLQATNLFTITKYDGQDPDVTINSYSSTFNPTARVDLTRGVDYGRYPTPRQFLIGLNITL